MLLRADPIESSIAESTSALVGAASASSKQADDEQQDDTQLVGDGDSLVHFGEGICIWKD